MTKTKKDVAISPKIEQHVKDALVLASEVEHRSQANMLAVMILEYCRTHNINLKNKG